MAFQGLYKAAVIQHRAPWKTDSAYQNLLCSAFKPLSEQAREVKA